MKILGISAFFHDSAAALVIDGRLELAAQEERFSRIKHDKRLPVEAIRFCLEAANLEIDQIDQIVFYEKPLRKFERIVVNQLRQFPRGLSQFTRAMSTWLSDRLWLKNDLVSRLGCRPDRVLFAEHHLSHAASAFFTSPFESAAVLTVDGVGEWATTSIFRGVSKDGEHHLDPLVELVFPHSIGLLYSALTAYLGFEVNEGEYKVMGLAAYGTPEYLEAFDRLATIEDDASIRVDQRYFQYQRHAERSFTRALEELLGPARQPKSELVLPATDSETRRFANVAASLQAFTERYLLAVAERARELTGERSLAFAGGVALNAVANRRLLEEGPFEAMFVHPAAGDAGGAVGAALWAANVLNGEPRAPAMTHSFLGRGFEPAEIDTFLSDCRIRHTQLATKDMERAVVDRLVRGQVGAWFQGRFEWGPRALGGRSIIADPRRADARERVNEKIKFREGFRPFAPAVLAEEFSRWFSLRPDRAEHMTPFMCCVAEATEEARRTIPAVVHVDGTARAQSVDAATNPRLAGLLEAFKQATGVGVLLNTSLNLKDEPICASPAEAYATFLRSDLDFLVLEQSLVEKRSLV